MIRHHGMAGARRVHQEVKREAFFSTLVVLLVSFLTEMLLV
jgi:hypothetical protein